MLEQLSLISPLRGQWLVLAESKTSSSALLHQLNQVWCDICALLTAAI